MTICEHVDKKRVTHVKNIATSPFRWGMCSKSREEVNATPNPVHRHNTAYAVTVRIPLNCYFVKIMVRGRLIKGCVPLDIC